MNSHARGRSFTLYDERIMFSNRNTVWDASSDGTLEERLYLLQNWRSDVVMVVEATGAGPLLVENIRYEAYGIPTAIPAGFIDRDNTDFDELDAWIGNEEWHARGDLDFDNDVDEIDLELADGYSTANAGRGVLSDRGNRKGYQGGELDLYATHMLWSWNAESALDSTLGRRPTRSSGIDLNMYDGTNGSTSSVVPGFPGLPADCQMGTIRFLAVNEFCQRRGFWSVRPGIRWCEDEYRCVANYSTGRTSWLFIQRKCGKCVALNTPAPPLTNPIAPDRDWDACYQWLRGRCNSYCQDCCDEMFRWMPPNLPTRLPIWFPSALDACYLLCPQ